MATLTKTKEYLKIGNKRIKVGKQRIFVVRHSDLLTENLSALPPGTTLAINYSGWRHRTDKQLIELMGLLVADQEMVQVLANHYHCPCCWNHALSYEMYVAIASVILGEQPSGRTHFSYSGIMETKGQEVYNKFSLYVQNGKYKTIEQQVREAVLPMLKPLLDFRDSVDNQTRKQFGLNL